jgi:hypothetical protein
MCEPDLAAGSMFGAGMPFSTARIATRLITSGTLSEVSELRVLLAHADTALAATIDRLARGWQTGQLPQLTESPLAIPRQAFWVDATAYAPVPLRAALDIFGTDRMVYGSDYPFAALLSPHGAGRHRPRRPGAGRLQRQSASEGDDRAADLSDPARIQPNGTDTVLGCTRAIAPTGG